MQVWDAVRGVPVTEPLRDRSPLMQPVFSEDGRRLLTVSGEGDGTVRIWDPSKGQPITSPFGKAVNMALFSADGHRVLTQSGQAFAGIWDSETGAPLAEPLQHNGRLEQLAFSPDGQQVLVLPEGSTVWVWNFPKPSTAAPPWLAELAEAVGGGMLDSATEVLRLRSQISASSSADIYELWARWFFSDRSNRTISPFSSRTAQDVNAGSR